VVALLYSFFCSPLLNIIVEELLKLVYVYQSYSKNICGARLYGPQCMTYTGERCDVAIDDSFTSGNVTGDVINKDDSFEENGTSLFSSFVSNCRMINYKI